MEKHFTTNLDIIFNFNNFIFKYYLLVTSCIYMLIKPTFLKSYHKLLSQ